MEQKLTNEAPSGSRSTTPDGATCRYPITLATASLSVPTVLPFPFPTRLVFFLSVLLQVVSYGPSFRISWCELFVFGYLILWKPKEKKNLTGLAYRSAWQNNEMDLSSWTTGVLLLIVSLEESSEMGCLRFWPIPLLLHTCFYFVCLKLSMVWELREFDHNEFGMRI